MRVQRDVDAFDAGGKFPAIRDFEIGTGEYKRN